ncbi:pilus assembly FimT family protein [Cellvibrio mixtus]|uniref:pilus assembly FimT family protein n=1 Tax=Cellvibrio mixtus TaxID=39650 RepID=UPI0009FF1E4F|nr:type II secretion system protein [Cellvibrio mixtus]
MRKSEHGFTLLELITVMILIGVISISLFSRIGSTGTAPVQSSRDDLIAALFFAQQQAMMRPGITLVVASTAVSVNRNGNPIRVSTFARGVTASPVVTLSYDRLGRTTAANIVVTGSGNSSGVSATVRVETSGYAFAN